jgi:hypothetical protein
MKTLKGLLILMTVSLSEIAVALDKAAHNASTGPAPALTLSERQRYYVPRQDLLMVLLDLYPQHEQIEAMDSAGREATLLATALSQANELVTRPGFGEITRVRVEFSYIKNLDEYARRDYRSMVRHGYILVTREPGKPFAVAEIKLAFKM